MTQSLANKQIIVGITGGIAAYKSADLVRRLREAGAQVRVVMTKSAKQFITPLTLQAVSGHPVHDDLFDLEAEAAMGHIELARWADGILVAPASADFIARLRQGEGSDLLTTLCLATRAAIAIAPAMNQAMWQNTSTIENIQVLRDRHIHIFGPGDGSQACGEYGPGRMLEPADLIANLSQLFQTGALAGQKVVITAGPTQEPLDPVRYISNHSSGKMGYALAEAAKEAGANVYLISGPVALPPPPGVQVIYIQTAQEMLNAVLANILDCDIFLGVAAISDYRFQESFLEKMPKNAETITLELVRNTDIIATVARHASRPKKVIGFAAETHQVLEKAKQKLLSKKLDIIIANIVGKGLGMGSNDNAVTVMWPGGQKDFPLLSKTALARELIAFIGNERATP